LLRYLNFKGSTYQHETVQEPVRVFDRVAVIPLFIKKILQIERSREHRFCKNSKEKKRVSSKLVL